MPYSQSFLYEARDKITPILAKINAANKKAGKVADKSFSQSNRKLNIYKRTVEKTKLAVKKLRKEHGSLGKAMKKAGSYMTTRLTLPIVAAGTLATANFARIESGLIDVLNLLDDNQVEQFRGQFSNLQKTAIQAGFAIDDVNKALFDNVSALGGSQQAVNTFIQAQKLARAGNAGLGVTVDGLTSIINAYGRATTKASDVANAFFSAQQKGKTTVADLANSIGRVAPIAKGLSVNFKQLLAATATMTLGGLSTEESTTALRGALASLQKPTKDAQRVLKRFKVPFGATQIQAQGLGKTLERLSIVAAEYPDELAKAIPNIRAFTGISSFSADKLKIYEETLAKINNDIKNNTGLTQASSRANKKLSVLFSELVGSLTIMLSTIVEVANKDGMLTDTIIYLTSVVRNITEYLKNNPVFTKILAVITGIVALLGPIISVVGTVMIAKAALAALGLSLGAILLVAGKVIAILAVAAAMFDFGRRLAILLKIRDGIEAIYVWTAKLFGLGKKGLDADAKAAKLAKFRANLEQARLITNEKLRKEKLAMLDMERKELVRQNILSGKRTIEQLVASRQAAKAKLTGQTAKMSQNITSTNNATADVQVTFNDPKDHVKSIKSKMTGKGTLTAGKTRAGLT
jgi:TP901 family phage tail tape measure protein